MDEHARAAFIIAQAAIAGMQAENQHRLSLGHSILYGEDAFAAIENQYMIGHNAVVQYLRG